MQETKVSARTSRRILCIQGSLCAFLWFGAPAGWAQAPAPEEATTPPVAAPKDDHAKQDEPPAVPTETYLLCAGDSLEVAVLLHPELSKVVTVAPDGRVSYPYMGAFAAVGLSLAQFGEKIQKGLSKEITDPQVNITLIRRTERTVSILGSGIRSSGKRVLNDDWHILDLLAEAGGLNVPRTDLVTATLFRRDNKLVSIDLVALMVDGDMSQNIKLEAGDTLIVEQRDVARTHIQVQGEVFKPGWVPVPADGSLLSVLTEVGGATPQASLSRAAIKRAGKLIPLDLSQLNTSIEAASFIVQPGDLLFIPMNKRMYAIFGAVAAPRLYGFPDHEPLNLMRALAIAGGTSPGADLKKATVLRGAVDSSRTQDQETRRQLAEAFSRLAGKFVTGTLTSAGIIGFYPLKSSLPSSDQPIDGVSYRVTMALQNGLSAYFSATREPDVIPINLEDLLSKGGSLGKDIALQPGDIVFVPSKNPGRKGVTLGDALSFVPMMRWFLH